MRKTRRSHSLNVITWIFLIGAILTLPLAIYAWAGDGFKMVPQEGWLSVVYIVLVPTVVAYYLNAWALTRVAPSIVAIYIYLQPLLALGVAPIVLGESWNSRTIVACVLIFAGVLACGRGWDAGSSCICGASCSREVFCSCCFSWETCWEESCNGISFVPVVEMLSGGGIAI